MKPPAEKSKIAALKREAHCRGALLHWGSCRIDWLKGRKGERFCLIAILDDATHQAWAHFAIRDSTTENMRLLGQYLSTFGRPGRILTSRPGLFQNNNGRTERESEPPSQIGRALRDLEIEWSPYKYPRTKRLLRHFFQMAQRRLVCDLHVAKVRSCAGANACLRRFLSYWNRYFRTTAADPRDAHRRLEKRHDLASILSLQFDRLLRPGGAFRWSNRWLRVAKGRLQENGVQVLQVQQRLDGSTVYTLQGQPVQVLPYDREDLRPVKRPRMRIKPRRGREWMKNFDLASSPRYWWRY